MQIKFQAFIPKNYIGAQPMSYHFRRHPHFNNRDLVNYNEFRAFLSRMDKTKGNWIPEPDRGHLGYYAMTDDGPFSNHTTNRLWIKGTLDLSRIGHYPSSGVFEPFKQRDSGCRSSHVCFAAIINEASIQDSGMGTSTIPTGK